jgi:hypothetical protein
MKKLFTLCLVVSCTTAFGQFAIINDKDGFCNVRSSAGKGDNIIDKLQNGHFVYCFPDSSNWVDIDYSTESKDLQGQVYKSRLKFISDYSRIPVSATPPSAIILSKDSIKVIITEKRFEKARHQFSFYKDAKTQVALIDHNKYWGTDGEVPTREYQSIDIMIGNRRISLPRSAFVNLYEPNLGTTEVNYDRANDIIYIQSMNSDGAGSYEVIWKIEKGVYKKRFVAYGF